MGNPTVTAKVVAKKGCKIRSERSLKSTCVALLAPGTLLSIEGCLGDARVATISPVGKAHMDSPACVLSPGWVTDTAAMRIGRHFWKS